MKDAEEKEKGAGGAAGGGGGDSSDSDDDPPPAKPAGGEEGGKKAADSDDDSVSSKSDAGGGGGGGGGGAEKEGEEEGAKDTSKEDEDKDSPAKGGKTGMSSSDSEDEEPAKKSEEDAGGAPKAKKIVDSDDDDDDEDKPKPPKKRVFASDSEDEEEKEKKSGDAEMKDADDQEGGKDQAVTAADVFGSDSDASDDEGAKGMVGQTVKLNKETGQLERGPAVPVPAGSMGSLSASAAERAEEREAAQGETLPLTLPTLPRPDPHARMGYLKLSKHLQLEPVVWEGKLSGTSATSQNVVRWRYKKAKEGEGEGEGAEGAEAGRGVESNARVVKWSDGTFTLHVGTEVLELKEEDLEENVHHIFVKQQAKHSTTDEEVFVVEGHGVLQSKLSVKPYRTSAVSKHIISSISREYNSKVDKSEMFIKKAIDENQQKQALTQKESMRIRNQAKHEAQSRRRGGGMEMTEDFLERDVEGDVGGMARAWKSRGRLNTSKLQKAKGGRAAGKKRGRDSESESESASSSESDRPRKVSSSSSSGSESSGDEEPAQFKKKTAAAGGSKKGVLDDSDSD